MKCDFWASFLAHTFASLCFGYEPKVRVMTINITKTQPICIILTPQFACEAKFPSTKERDMDKPIFGRGGGCC